MTIILMLISVVSYVWIMTDPSAGQLHYAFTHYDQKSFIAQFAYAGACVIISFAGGWLFRK
jgi:hypothetical protein